MSTKTCALIKDVGITLRRLVDVVYAQDDPKGKVIVCDRNETVRKLMFRFLQNEGYNNIVLIADEEDCLGYLENNSPPVVLFIHEYNILEKIKDRGFIKVILTSGELTALDRKELSNLCDFWIKKPCLGLELKPI